MRNQPARTPWHSNQITDEIEPSERGQHVLGTRRNNERRTGKLRCAKPSAPKSGRRRMKPLLHRRKSKADAPTSESRAGVMEVEVFVVNLAAYWMVGHLIMYQRLT